MLPCKLDITPRSNRICAKSGIAAMDKFIHRENLTLFKKRLAEARTDADRDGLTKLLAEEEAKEPLLNKGLIKPR